MEEFITFKNVQELTKKSKPTIWRWEKEGLMPKKRKFGIRSVGWLKSEIEHWIQESI